MQILCLIIVLSINETNLDGKKLKSIIANKLNRSWHIATLSSTHESNWIFITRKDALTTNLSRATLKPGNRKPETGNGKPETGIQNSESGTVNRNLESRIRNPDNDDRDNSLQQCLINKYRKILFCWPAKLCSGDLYQYQCENSVDLELLSVGKENKFI